MAKVLNRGGLYKPIAEGAVLVARPSKWGNPFKVYPHRRGGAFAHQIAVAAYKEWLLSGALDSPIKDIEELRGKDLVCYCAPLPCHADVLLELANKNEVGNG